jgi:hypothetical protein
LTDADRVELWEYFRADVARLEEMLGVDLSHWAPGAGAASASYSFNSLPS